MIFLYFSHTVPHFYWVTCSTALFDSISIALTHLALFSLLFEIACSPSYTHTVYLVVSIFISFIHWPAFPLARSLAPCSFARLVSPFVSLGIHVRFVLCVLNCCVCVVGPPCVCALSLSFHLSSLQLIVFWALDVLEFVILNFFSSVYFGLLLFGFLLLVNLPYCFLIILPLTMIYGAILVLPFVQLHVTVQPLCDQALPPSIRHVASPAPSEAVKYNGRTSAHFLSPSDVRIVTTGDTTGDECAENYQPNTISSPTWRLRHSARSTMGSERHLSQSHTSTPCWDGDTSELNLRSSVFRFSPLPSSVCRRSAGGNIKLVNVQRRARSTWNMSSNTDLGTNQRVPSQFLDALFKDVSRTDSYMSVYSGTMTPSSDSGNETHDNQSISKSSYALDNRSKVSPNAPKTILLLPPHPILSVSDSRSSSYRNRSRKYCSNSYDPYSNSRSSTPLLGQSLQFRHGKSGHLRGKIPSFSSLVVDHQASADPHIITASRALSSRNSVTSHRAYSNAASVENFMQGAQLSSGCVKGDPCELAQRESAHLIIDRRSLGDRTSGSHDSSGRFSRNSAHSLPPTFGTRISTLDRRSRQSRLRTQLWLDCSSR